MKLFKAMVTVAGLTGLSRIVGFIRDIMMAAVLGAGPLADAFFVALKLPNFFRRITAEGAFSISFVPLYSEAMEKEGRKSADDFAGNAMVLMFWGLLVFTILVIWFMPVVISLIAPGFRDDPERFNLAVTLSRITFPYLLMMSVASLMGGVLNAHGRFAPFAAAPVLFNLSLIILLVIAWNFKSVAHALAWGVLIAGFVQFGLLYLYIRREGIELPIGRPKIDDRIKKLFKLMGPGALGAGVVQINLFADMIIGSFLPRGSISYLYYADRLNQLPLSTVGIAVGTALLPMLSKALSGGRTDEAGNLFNRALEIVLFLGMPAAVALFVLADPIISILFERGAFTHEASLATSAVLKGYVIGLPAYIAVKVFSTAFWSNQDTVTPVKMSIIVTLANIALALILIQFMGVAGIATATGIVGWLYIALLARPLKGQPAMAFDARFKRSLPRIFASACVMGLALYGILSMVGPWIDGSEFHRIAALAILVGSGLVVYGIAVFVTGAITKDELKYLSRKKV